MDNETTTDHFENIFPDMDSSKPELVTWYK